MIFIPVAKDNFLFGVESEFSGTRTLNSQTGEFELSFEILNKHDQESFNIDAGDELKVSWEVKKGSITLYIMDEDQNTVYKADGRKAVDTADFSLVAAKGGEYTVHIIGYKASGTVKVEHNK